MPVVSVSIPDELLKRLDDLAAAHDYTGRSEVVREGTRALLTEFEADRLEGRILVGIVSDRYEFDTPSVERRIATLRRDFDRHVVSSDHSHVHDDCLDVFVLETELEPLSAFVGRLRGINDVETVDHSVLPLETVNRIYGN